MSECCQQKHTQHAPSTKMECDYFNNHMCKTLTPNGEPRDTAGNTEEEEEEEEDKEEEEEEEEEEDKEEEKKKKKT